MAKSVPCHHRLPDKTLCPGRMVVRKGSETALMLHCRKCGEYYYRIGNVTCVLCCWPKDTAAADRLLAAPAGQHLKPEIAAKIQNLRRNLGLK